MARSQPEIGESNASAAPATAPGNDVAAPAITAGTVAGAATDASAAVQVGPASAESRLPSEDSMPSSPARTCGNCATVLAGRFCHQCGQDERRARLHFPDLLRETIRDGTNLDTPTLRTVVGLFLRPGRMCSDYLSGHRVRYISPLRFYLITGALAIATLQLTMSLTERHFASEAEAEAHRVVDMLLKWSHLFTLVSFPPGALILQGLFRGSERQFLDHLVIMLYTGGAVFIVMAAASPAYLWFPFGASGVLSLMYFAYFGWACVQFYPGPRWLVVLKSVVVLFVCTVIYLMISFAAAIALTVWILLRGRETAQGVLAGLSSFGLVSG